VDFVAFLLFLAGFFFAVEEVCSAGLVVELLEDCPATGETINKKESRPAKKREAACETVVGEDATLISSLYFVLAPDADAGNHWRYRKRRKVGQLLRIGPGPSRELCLVPGAPSDTLI
jgi:hypothetical protein